MSEQASDVIAQELALRFRVLARALDRFDRLEGEREFVGWLAQLAGDQRTLEAVSTTLTLQAVQAAAEEETTGCFGFLAPKRRSRSRGSATPAVSTVRHCTFGSGGWLTRGSSSWNSTASRCGRRRLGEPSRTGWAP